MKPNMPSYESITRVRKHGKETPPRESVELRGNIVSHSAIVYYKVDVPYERWISLTMKGGGSIDTAELGFHADEQKHLTFGDSAGRAISVFLPMDMFRDCFSVLKSAQAPALILSYDPETYLLTEFMLIGNGNV
jgi:hypothetical protein